MYKIFLIFLLLVGCTPHYIQPIYEPLSYEKKILDLSTYKEIKFKQNNNDICLTSDNYQLLIFLLVDLKNYIEYQKIVIHSLDEHQQNIFKKSSKK